MNPLGTRPPLLALLTALALGGCASLEKARDSWQGAHYDEVITRWGAPTRSAQLVGGGTAHTWVTDGGYAGGGGVMPSVGIFGGSGGVGVGTSIIFGGGGSAEPIRCERTLIFKDDRVVDQNWMGDASFCSQFRRE